MLYKKKIKTFLKKTFLFKISPNLKIILGIKLIENERKNMI
jgi:hypothetical protein